MSLRGSDRSLRILAFSPPVLLGLLALALVLPAAAGAAAVALKVTPVPISGFRDTGSLLGGGAALKLALTVTGTEADGAPSPLGELTLALPPGTRISSAGFSACPLRTLRSHGPAGCPSGSRAGPEGVDRIAGVAEEGLVKEEGTAQALFAPAGELYLYASNPFPLSAAMIAQGSFARPGALGGPELHLVFTSVRAMVGAPDISMESLHLTFGGARRARKGRVDYYLTLPRTCPVGGWGYRSSVLLQSTQVLTATGLIPCPTRAAPRPGPRHKHRRANSRRKHRGH